MSEVERSWDVIVVGSGLGGLTSATRLARTGLKVLVLEQHEFAGGYAHHFLRKVKGSNVVYDFDVALHQTGDLKPGRSMHRTLAELGVLERIGLNQFDVAYRTRGPAHDLVVPADADKYRDLLCDSYPEQAGPVRDLFALLKKVDSVDGPNEHTLALMGRNLKEVMDEHGLDERMQGVFATLWGYLGLPPSKVCAFTYSLMWNSFHSGGCFYVKGGGQALSDAFVDVIEENDGRVMLRTAVEGIVTEGGRAVGVDTVKRGSFRAPVVISNASAPATFEKLLDDSSLAPDDRKTAAELPVACSIHQAYIGMRGDAAALGLRDRGYFVNPTYDLDAEWEASLRGDYRSQGCIVNNHNIADPGHHPPGRSVIHVAMIADGRHWLGLDEDDYRARKQELEEHLVDRLAEHIPDVRERIEVCETGTPHTMQRYSWNPGGSIYGWAMSTSSHSILRSQPRTTVPGLYLAGAWTFPSAGFGGAMTSGHNTAGLVLEDYEGRPAAVA